MFLSNHRLAPSQHFITSNLYRASDSIKLIPVVIFVTSIFQNTETKHEHHLAPFLSSLRSILQYRHLDSIDGTAIVVCVRVLRREVYIYIPPHGSKVSSKIHHLVWATS